MDNVIVRNASVNNLKNVSISIPLSKYVVFTGKSGSGKSTLAVNVIMAGYLNKSQDVVVPKKPALFAQRIEMPSKSKSLEAFLGIKKCDSAGTLRDFIADVKTVIDKDVLLQIVELLSIDELLMNRNVSHMSMTEYNKCRFVKMLIHTDAKLLIVDELSATMTYEDTENIALVYKLLVKNGYSLFIIDHSLSIIRHSDYVIEMGPEAGSGGGNVIFQGEFKKFQKSSSWKKMIEAYNKGNGCQKGLSKKLKIHDITYRNMKELSLELPLHGIVSICGGMGAGKSSILDIIFKACDKSPMAWKNREGVMGEIEGKSNLRRPYIIDQSPIGKNAMSTPATYTKIMDSLRKIYVDLCDPSTFTVSDFSYNAKGKCAICGGKGYKEIALDDEVIYERCPSCQGKRFNNHTLEIKDGNLDIGDTLNITCRELYSLFKVDNKKKIITEKIQFLNDVGLSYLALGQPSGTLSGGESQRIKIAKELSKKLGDRCLFILDSPAKGLHVLDLPKIISVLRKLVEKNNSIIISENSPYFLRNSDWLIYLDNGKLIYQGKPDGLPKRYKEKLGMEEKYE